MYNIGSNPTCLKVLYKVLKGKVCLLVLDQHGGRDKTIVKRESCLGEDNKDINNNRTLLTYVSVEPLKIYVDLFT